MKFDVIIATFNRKESLAILVSQILECSKLPENIIIVDSSTVTDADLSPVKNTLITEPEPTDNSSGGGTLAWLSLLLISILTLRTTISR